MAPNEKRPRMTNPVLIVPAAMQALQALSKAADATGAPPTTIALVTLRASQINGCSVCVDMHARGMRKAGETEERLAGVAAWRDMPYFTEPERAALALAEAVTRIADSSDPVPDGVWDEARRHFDEPALAGILLSLAAINAWNRLNIPTRQVAGEWVAKAGEWNGSKPESATAAASH
jgi:AhpD family alkylhydroperoxidase